MYLQLELQVKLFYWLDNSIWSSWHLPCYRYSVMGLPLVFHHSLWWAYWLIILIICNFSLMWLFIRCGVSGPKELLVSPVCPRCSLCIQQLFEFPQSSVMVIKLHLITWLKLAKRFAGSIPVIIWFCLSCWSCMLHLVSSMPHMLLPLRIQAQRPTGSMVCSWELWSISVGNEVVQQWGWSYCSGWGTGWVLYDW